MRTAAIISLVFWLGVGSGAAGAAEEAAHAGQQAGAPGAHQQAAHEHEQAAHEQQAAHEHEQAAHEQAAHEQAAHEHEQAAHDPDAHEHPAHAVHAAHEKHHRFHLGLSGVTLAAFENPTDLHYGGGGFFTVSVVPGWLEVELVFHALIGSHGVVDLPIDLLLKKPFHVNRWLHPFIGLGPTMVVVCELDETAVYFGGATATGIDFWVTRQMAIVAEFNFNLIYRTIVIGARAETAEAPAEGGSEIKGLVPEVGGALGVLFGF